MSEIIKYWDFEIEPDNDTPHRWVCFGYVHKDYDGTEDDDRHGYCGTLEECKQEIDDWYKGDSDEKQ